MNASTISLCHLLRAVPWAARGRPRPPLPSQSSCLWAGTPSAGGIPSGCSRRLQPCVSQSRMKRGGRQDTTSSAPTPLRSGGEMAQRPRDALRSPRPWGSSGMAVDERGAERLPAERPLERRQRLHAPGSFEASLSQLRRCCRVARACWMRCASPGYLSRSSASGFFKERR